MKTYQELTLHQEARKMGSRRINTQEEVRGASAGLGALMT